jgi:hypothetical protein
VHSARSPIAAAVLLLASTLPTRAQDRVPLNGWGVLGIGTGSANIACAGCTSGWKLAGPTLLCTVGLMVTPRLGVGVGLDEWWLGPAADTEVIKTGTLLVHYYPTVRPGAFVEAGLGLARAEVRLDGSTMFQGRPVELIAEGSGLGFVAAVGYDLRLVRGKEADLIVTPRVSYVYGSIGDLESYVYSPNGDRHATGRPPFATVMS